MRFKIGIFPQSTVLVRFPANGVDEEDEEVPFSERNVSHCSSVVIINEIVYYYSYFCCKNVIIVI